MTPPREGTRWAHRLKFFDEQARTEIDEAIRDPDLMDVRGPIALSDHILAATPLLAPESVLHVIAQQRKVRALGGEILATIKALAGDAEHARDILRELTEPTPAELLVVQLELNERALRIVGDHSKTQVNAVKMLEWAKVVREQALPLLGELGLRIGSVLKRYVPGDKLEAATEEVRAAMRGTLGELASARDLSKPPP